MVQFSTFQERRPTVSSLKMPRSDIKTNVLAVVPLILQALPAICLVAFIFCCHESPRFLAKQDKWEKAEHVLTTVRQLPRDHPYIRQEITDIANQLEHERMLIGGASFMDLQKEMWTIPGNRKRALVSIGLMICQQMTGTSKLGLVHIPIAICSNLSQTPSITTRRKSSRILASLALALVSSLPVSMVRRSSDGKVASLADAKDARHRQGARLCRLPAYCGRQSWT